MKIVQRFARPPDMGAAFALAEQDSSARWLAGGTSLLAGDYADKPASVIDIGAFIPRGIELREGLVAIGAGTTFQEIAESPSVPFVLKRAALGQGSRNVRNRATIGGNIAADRSSSAFIPALLVLDAKLEIAIVRAAGPTRTSLDLASYLAAPSGLILSVSFPIPDSRRTGYGRWARTSNDSAILVAAVSFSIDASLMKNFEIAMGGISTKSRRMNELEKRFEGMPIPTEAASGEDFRDIVEKAALPLLVPTRGGAVSAPFRKLRGAALLAEVMAEAAQGRVEKGAAR
ncbi:MAG: FAD binding domain-containing protein [Rectinemataceae bacterium]